MKYLSTNTLMLLGVAKTTLFNVIEHNSRIG